MGIAIALMTRPAEAEERAVGHTGGWHSIIREPYTGAWQRNDELRPDSVLSHPTVYRCINLIASDVAKMRFKLVELRYPPELWVETESPAFSPVLRRPNHYQTAAQFRKWWMVSRLVHGNTYVLKERDGRDVVTRLHILDPNRVTVAVTPDGDVIYKVSEDNLAGITSEDATYAIPAEEIIHDRIPLFHPLVGVSPLFAAGGPAYVGLTVQRNSGEYFDNDANPPGILTGPAVINEQMAKTLVERWHARRRGQIAALGSGLEYKPMHGTATESQTIEHLKWTSESVAAAFGVPAFMVGAGPVPALNNSEVLTRQYYTTCLHDHVHDMESALDEGLGLEETVDGGKRLGVELNVAALMQMDTATQVKMLTEGIRGGLMAPNEGRAKADLEPLVGGNTVYLQHQDYPIEALYDRTLNETPAALPPAQQAPPPPALPPGESDTEDRDALALVAEAELQMLMIQAA
jgi:HK97 family phage portal protein